MSLLSSDISLSILREAPFVGGGNFWGGRRRRRLHSIFFVVASVFAAGFLLEGHVDIGFKMTGTLYWKDSAPF